MKQHFAKFIALLAVGFCCPLMANSQYVPATPLVADASLGSHHVGIRYKSQLLPNWAFNVNLKSSERQSGVWIDSVNQVLSLESLSVSAKRALSDNSPQWIYAKLSSTQYRVAPQGTGLPLADDNDMAATVGWEFGQNKGFGVAVGYEFRNIGKVNVNSLVMGVHYYF